MSQETTIVVVDQEGQAYNARLTEGDSIAEAFYVVQEGEREVQFPQRLLRSRSDGRYDVDLHIGQALAEAYTSASHVIPVIEETVTVGKRTVEGSSYHIRTHVEQQIENVEVPLQSEEVEIKTVELNQEVSEPSGVRQENGTTIIPIYEEYLVVEKRLRLIKELHVTTKRKTTVHQEQVALRKEVVDLEVDKGAKNK